MVIHAVLDYLYPAGCPLTYHKFTVAWEEIQTFIRQASTILQPFSIYANHKIDHLEEIRYTRAGGRIFDEVTKLVRSLTGEPDISD